MRKAFAWSLLALLLLAVPFVLAPQADATSCALKMASGLFCDTQCTYIGGWYCIDEGPTCCAEDSYGCKNLNSSECSVCAGPGCTLGDF